MFFLPLGGTGEIGMNLNLYGYEGKWLIVDCGVTFRDENIPGVDIIMPDIHALKGHEDKISGSLRDLNMGVHKEDSFNYIEKLGIQRLSNYKIALDEINFKSLLNGF